MGGTSTAGGPINANPTTLWELDGAQYPNHTQKGSGNKNVDQQVEGLLPPTLEATGQLVSGKDIKRLRLQNKRRQHALQEQQEKVTCGQPTWAPQSSHPQHRSPQNGEVRCARWALQLHILRGNY
jgi:hypothetical protein